MDEREQARIARNAYFREWRKNNPEKVRRNQEKYWLRKFEQMAKSGEVSFDDRETESKAAE